VRAVVRDGVIEVSFPFSPSDVERIKSVPGRRWDAEHRTWSVPHSEEAMAALRGAFGARLVSGSESSRPFAPLLERVRVCLRSREYSGRTEQAYLGWIRRYLDFRASDPDRSLAAHRITMRSFLEHLALRERLASKTRNQAASAIAFLVREVLGEEHPLDLPRAKGPPHLPAVLSHREAITVLDQLHRRHALAVSLLYGAGLRIEECLSLRVKDVDFELRQILVRDGKGKKDRYAPLPHRLVEPLRAQIAWVAEQHRRDLARGEGWAALPGALHRKDPRAGHDLAWQFVFPSRKPTHDPATDRVGRAHLHPSAVQREVKRAAEAAGITKRVGCHTFRHTFATEALRGGCDIRTLQHVLGHKDVRTTMIYLHVVEQTGYHIRSPLDRPDDP
jgi:integron integrase